jgi:hypothetical protein
VLAALDRSAYDRGLLTGFERALYIMRSDSSRQAVTAAVYERMTGEEWRDAPMSVQRTWVNAADDWARAFLMQILREGLEPGTKD